MAIYSLNLGFISRSAGRSTVGFSAYISASQQIDERTGVHYDYVCKNDVIVSRILTPQDAPEWAKNSSTLWNKAEQFEDEWVTLRFRGNTRDAEKNQKSLEAREKFLSSAQTAQTIMGAIPIEFTPLEAEACVEEFLKDRFVSRGLVVEYAIHWDRGNPHFHGQITRRALVEEDPRDKGQGTKFSERKDQEIVSKPELLVTRQLWEKVVNKHLELGGHEVRIDCRSYEDRGSLLLPTHHEGWYGQRLAEQGQYSRIVSDNEAIRQKNIEILCKNPEALIQEIALKRTTFTKRHVEEEIIRRVGGDERLFALLKAKVEDVNIPADLILNCANQNVDQNVIFEGGGLRGLAAKLTDRLLDNQDVATEVGENLNRDIVFTSTAYKKQEESLVQLADTLHQRSTKIVSEDIILKALAYGEEQLGRPFSGEQREATHHLCSGPDLRILNGKAGTGKTTLLKAAAHAYQEAGYEVIGTTFQGKAVDIMEEEVGISCRTMDSFMHAWNKHQEQKDLVENGKLWGRPYMYAFNKMKDLEKNRFTSNMVILVDEANMIGGRLWEPFLTEATNCGAKVLVIQDPSQIKSREPGDYGRLFAERFGFCATSEVVRQRVPWQRDCSKLLNEHQVLDGLKPYYDKGHFKWFENGTQAHQALAQDYVKDLMANPHQTRIALAYQNTEVYELNQAIRAALIENGCLGEAGKQDHLQHHLLQEFKIQGEIYVVGDRIRFTQNDNHGQHIRNIGEQPSLLNSLVLGGGQDQTEGLRPGIQKSFKKGVKNGSFGTIEAFDERKSLLTVVLDDKRHIQFDIHNVSPYHPWLCYGNP
jgi:ATP-dependent exoDNAse (exonuclease V) alpha subunit